MQKFILLTMFVAGSYFTMAEPVKSRIKGDTPEVNDNDLPHLTFTEIGQVGKALLHLSSFLETKVDAIKLDFIQEVQEIRSELKMESEELVSTLGKEIQGLQSELRKERDAIKNRLFNLLEISSSLGTVKTQTQFNSLIEKLFQLSTAVEQELMELKSQTDRLEQKIVLDGIAVENISKIWETPASNGTGLLKEVLSSVAEVKKEAISSSGKITDKANRVLDELGSFMKDQLNGTLKTITALANNTVSANSELWSVLKVTNFPHNLLKNAGLLRNDEWVVIQARGVPVKSGRVRQTFQKRSWSEYKNGFGSYDADFWLGLEKMRDLSEAGFTELRVDLEDWEGNKAFALYKNFGVAPEEGNYRLRVSGYSGNAGDSLHRSNGQPFSTVDKDHEADRRNCAEMYGGWWHDTCGNVWLNYDYRNESRTWTYNGIAWKDWKGWEYSLKATEMKLRRPASIK